jgi:ABC-2 type transport system permease protein
MSPNLYSWSRLWAIIVKEFVQLKRDYTTFAMIISIPLIQIVLFGYAINNDAKHLPLVIVAADQSSFTRTISERLQKTQYFNIVAYAETEAEAERLMATGQAQFILNIPSDFSRKLVRHEQPHILLEADATDPTGISNALNAASTLSGSILNQDLTGPLEDLQQQQPAFKLDIHPKYNPTALTQFYVVPGLLGVILTMTLVMVTAMAITKERERGTIESLLITPAKPIEVIIGKAIPYIVVGYAQTILVLVTAYYLFEVPIRGSIALLMFVSLPFILANLLVGIDFSTLAENQLQASQMSTFFFLPSILLSGFAFPFRGMPEWAQWIGNTLPMTHYVNITRGIMLKGNSWSQIWPNFWPILVFMLLAAIIAVSRYKQTLD